MNEYNTGDIVQLKSGGPKMTVSSSDGEHVYCQWFAGSKLERGMFESESLQYPPSVQDKP